LTLLWAFILPSCRFGGGSALRRELHSCFADQPRFELKIRTPCHHGHARPIGQPNKRPDADGSLYDVCACVAHYGPQECRQISPATSHDLNAEKIQRVKCFLFTRSGICCVQQFSNVGAAGWVRKFLAMVNRRKWQLISPCPVHPTGRRQRSEGLACPLGGKVRRTQRVPSGLP
jgi:hypothetical protein